MAEISNIVNSIQNSGGGREFNQNPSLRTNNGELGDAGVQSHDELFTQDPEQFNYDSSSNLDGGNALWFPEDLGSPSNAYYTKLEVYIVDSGKGESVKKTVGDGVYNMNVGTTDEGFRASQTTNANGTQYEGQLRKTGYRRLNEVIALPMPEGIVTDHSTLWSKAEGGLTGAMIAAGDNLTSANGLGGKWDEAVKAAGSSAMSVAAKVTNFMQENFDLAGAETALKQITKRASNPRNEFLFDGVNNRSFNLQWKFFPKSAVEAMKLRMILEKMKLYMYPELDQSLMGSFYLFPAMFDITFMHGAAENEWLYRTSTCAMTNMIINYAGAGQWIATDYNGAPVAWEVTMQFTEIEFLHRDRFRNLSNPNGVAR